MSEKVLTDISGACHCGNIRYVLAWPDAAAGIAVRRCGCTFCQKHGGVWTSNRNAALRASVADRSKTTKYQFGTATADFYICSQCGAAPFVVSEIDGALYAVVNVNTFEDFDRSLLSESTSDFDGEATTTRLERRKNNWIADVEIREAQV